MSWQATSWAIGQRVGDPSLKMLLLVIGGYANAEGEMWYSQEKIADDTEISVRTLRRHLHKLVDLGLISVEQRRRGDGTKDTALITVLMAPPAKLAPEANKASGGKASHRTKTGGTTGQIGTPPPDTKVAGQESSEIHQEESLFSAEWENPSAPTVKPKKIKHQIPASFAITEDHMRFARERDFEPAEARLMFEKFKAYHQGKGSLMLDWNACWRTWVLNQVGFRNARDPSNHKPFSNNPII